MDSASLSRVSLKKSATEISSSVHLFCAMKKFAEVERNNKDLVLRTQAVFAENYVSEGRYELQKFKAFVQELQPAEKAELKERSFKSLAFIDFVHKARLYVSNTGPLAVIAAPMWVFASWVDNFNSMWQLGALTVLATAAVGYRALRRDPYYDVGAKKELEKVLSDGEN